MSAIVLAPIEITLVIMGSLQFINIVQSIIRTRFNFDPQNIILVQEQQKTLNDLIKNFKFQKKIVLNGINRGTDFTDEEFNEMGAQKIIRVKRFSRTLGNSWFPTQIISPVTWLLAGVNLRHEFIILESNNFLFFIDVEVINGQSFLSINIQSLAQNTFSELEAEYLKTQKHHSCVQDLSLNQLQPELSFIKIYLLLHFWIFFAEQNKYDIMKNSKTLARSILYFSMNNSSPSIVRDSLLGKFTEKTFGLPNPVNFALEEGSFQLIQTNDNVKEALQTLDKTIQHLRLVQMNQQQQSQQ